MRKAETREEVIARLLQKLEYLKTLPDDQQIPVSHRMPVKRYKRLVEVTLSRVRKGRNADIGDTVNSMVDHCTDDCIFFKT